MYVHLSLGFLMLSRNFWPIMAEIWENESGSAVDRDGNYDVINFC